MVRLLTLSRKIFVNTTVLSKDTCAENKISPRNCNDRPTNNYIDVNALDCIDRKGLGLNKIEENRSMHPHPGVDNYQCNQDIFIFNENDLIPNNDFKNKHDTSVHNESCENAHKDIVPTGFPDKNIKFNSDLNARMPHTLNPSAIPFYPQNYYEPLYFIEQCSHNDEKYADCINEHTNIDIRKSYNDRNDKSNYYEFSILSQNVRSLKDDVKSEGILNSMIENNVDVFLLQETWLVGNKMQVIRGHMVFFHGLSKSLSSRG